MRSEIMYGPSMYTRSLFAPSRLLKLAALFAAILLASAALIAGRWVHEKWQTATSLGLIVAKPIEQAAFPLKAEPGARYLTDRNGKPFLIHGDTAWSLIADPSREEVDIYIADRRARGFNAILVNLIEHKFARKAPRNFYEDLPFSKPGDFTKPNEAYFAHADWVLQRAREAGLLVLLTPAYIGTSGGEEGWWSDMIRAGDDALRAYGRFLGKRYGGFDNIVWVHAGDYDPPDKAPISAIAEELKNAAPGQLHTVHNAPETFVPDFWRGASWLDLTSVYTYKPVCERMASAYLDRQIRSAFLFESAYENEHGADARRIRTQAYHALLCGASGHLYGNNPVWRFHDKGIYPAPYEWWPALGSPGAQSMTHLIDLFSGLPWWNLIPDLEGKFITDGRGDGEERVAAAIAEDGSMAVLYFPTERKITADLGRLKDGSIEAVWFDPTSGRMAQTDQIPADRPGGHTFAPPGLNASGDGDWLLILKASALR